MRHRSWAIFGLIVSIGCGIQVNFVSSMLHPRFEHRGESVAKELAVVRGESYVIDGVTTYWPEFQNRVAFGLVLTMLDKAGGLTTSQWYQVLRLAFAIAAFASFWLLLWGTRISSPRQAAAACILLAFTFGLHFNHGWEHPSDYLDPIVFSAFLWAVFTRRAGWLAVFAVLGALNRESAVFAGLLWFCVYGVRVGSFGARWPRVRVAPREAAVGIAIMALGYAAVVGFRALFGGDRGTSQMQHSSFYYWGDMIREVLATLAPTSWPILLLTIAAMPLSWIAANRRWVTEADVGLLVGALGIFVISAIFSLLPELRMLIPMSMVLVFVAAVVEGRRTADARAGSGVRSIDSAPGDPVAKRQAGGAVPSRG